MNGSARILKMKKYLMPMEECTSSHSLWNDSGMHKRKRNTSLFGSGCDFLRFFLVCWSSLSKIILLRYVKNLLNKKLPFVALYAWFRFKIVSSFSEKANKSIVCSSSE